MITERFTSGTSTTDADGNKAGTRTFVAIGYNSLASALNDFHGNPSNLVYPDDLALLYDSVQTGRNDSGSYEIVASYSTMQLTRLRRRPQDHPIWNRSANRAVEDIGFNARGYVTTGAGVAEAVIPGWLGEKAMVEDWRTRRSVTVTVSNVDNINIFDPIDDQLSNLHMLGGKLWQFVSGGTTFIAPRKYEATYTWELDKGTPFPTPRQIFRGAIMVARFDPAVNGDLNPDAPIIRKPYHKMRPIKPTQFGTADVNLWLFYLRCDYITDENGWQLLPGVPPL